MKRPAVIIGALVVFAVAIITYVQQLPPEGIEPKGDSEAIAWISLAVAVLSLLTAIVGLIQKVIELRASAR